MATDLANWERGIDDAIKVVRWRQGAVKPELKPLYEELIMCMEAVKSRGCFETYSQLDACTQCGRLKGHHSITAQEDCRFLSEIDKVIKMQGVHWDAPKRTHHPHDKRYVYLTNCTESTEAKINLMRLRAQKVTYITMQKHCADLKRWALDHGYRRLKTKGPTLRTDPHVSFHKSIYDGRPCYYLVWSAIEWIWVLPEES